MVERGKKLYVDPTVKVVAERGTLPTNRRNLAEAMRNAIENLPMGYRSLDNLDRLPLGYTFNDTGIVVEARNTDGGDLVPNGYSLQKERDQWRMVWDGTQQLAGQIQSVRTNA